MAQALRPMKTNNRKARAFYLVRYDARQQVLSHPYDRHTSQEDAKTAAKRNGSQVLSAKDYRELTGRTAATDFARSISED